MIENLILVGGHAIFHGRKSIDVLCDTNWYLYDFQKGEPKLYIEHIKAGVEEACKDKHSLLIFSGGQTRELVGPLSESQSYWSLAEHFSWWNHPEIRRRSTTEEFARDTLENILFSICRFYEFTNRFPAKITAIGWGFKNDRYVQHCSTLQFPLGKFKHIAVNNPVNLVLAIKGERINCQEPYKHDPLGCTRNGGTLCNGQSACIVTKKEARNPFNRFHPYEISCPELAELVCYNERCIPKRLPW